MPYQRGYSLPSLLLWMVVASLFMATTIPALFNWHERWQQKTQLVSAVTETLAAMNRAQMSHWAHTQCRFAPTSVTLLDLVSVYEAPASVLASPLPLTVTFQETLTSPAISNALVITVTASNLDEAIKIGGWLAPVADKITVADSNIVVSQSVIPIATLNEQQHFNPATGCME